MLVLGSMILGLEARRNLGKKKSDTYRERKGACPSGIDSATQCIIDNDTNSWRFVTTSP